jgi:hypothetical protein
MIVNFHTQLGAFYTWIATKWLSFPVYAGKPITEDSDVYGYFKLVQNTTITSDDNKGYMVKKATLDFAIIWQKKDISDMQMWVYLDSLSNAVCTLSESSWFDMWDVYIYSIEEGNQSGVERDDNQNPYIVAEYFVTYKSL